jgi:hypothetical protein
MATIAFGAPSLARKRRYSAVSKQNSRASSQLPCKLLATACREALMRVLHKVASLVALDRVLQPGLLARS